MRSYNVRNYNVRKNRCAQMTNAQIQCAQKRITPFSINYCFNFDKVFKMVFKILNAKKYIVDGIEKLFLIERKTQIKSVRNIKLISWPEIGKPAQLLT